jgi:hypothetical protein
MTREVEVRILTRGRLEGRTEDCTLHFKPSCSSFILQETQKERAMTRYKATVSSHLVSSYPRLLAGNWR